MKIKKKYLAVLLLALAPFLFIGIIPIFSQECNQPRFGDMADVIIVLGSPADKFCQPSPILRERVNTGVLLYNRGTAKKILFTGGSVANGCVEADVMVQYAKLLGVPDTAIIIEKNALNTYQNAYYSVRKMGEFKIKSAVVVTSKFHLKRACRIFSNYDIDYYVYSSLNPSDISNFKFVSWRLREHCILAYHAVFGYKKNFGLNKSEKHH